MVLMSSTTISESRFVGCRSSSESGGAFHLDDASTFLQLIRCQFTNCRSVGSGGAIFASVASFSVDRSSFVRCSAAIASSLLAATPAGSSDIYLSSALCCRSRRATMAIRTADELLLALSNISANQARDASAFDAEGRAAVRGCAFCDNSDGNCATFGGHDVTRLTFANNSCRPTRG
jgi:hypothetical protein